MKGQASRIVVGVWMVTLLTCGVCPPVWAQAVENAGFGRVKTKDLGYEPDLKERVRKARAASARLRGNIRGKRPEYKNSRYLSDGFFDELIADPDLTYWKFHEAMKSDYQYLSSCLAGQEQNARTRRWIRQYQDIVDRVWEDEIYGDLSSEYLSKESCTQSGPVAYGVKVERDPADETILWIQNFYNIGFRHKIRIDQAGQNLLINPQLLSGHRISGTGSISSEGAINTRFTIDSGDPKTLDTCTIALTPR